MALDRTKSTKSEQTDEHREQAFMRRTRKYFRQGGIDPDKPAEQSKPRDFLPLSSLKVEIEGWDEDEEKFQPGTKVHILT
jgi:hypothetical protein